jgi:hypothetical protein
VLASAEFPSSDTTLKDRHCKPCQLAGTVRGTARRPHFSLAIIPFGHYLRNRSTLDTRVLGYIGIPKHKEHPPEVLSIPPGTRCITRLASNEMFSPSNKIHREVGRAKDLSAPLYRTDCCSVIGILFDNMRPM